MRRHLSLLVILLAGTFAFSCKKVYTCDCLTSEQITPTTAQRQTNFYSNGAKPYPVKMTQKQANSACEHEKEAIQSSYENWWTKNDSLQRSNVVIRTNCTLR